MSSARNDRSDRSDDLPWPPPAYRRAETHPARLGPDTRPSHAELRGDAFSPATQFVRDREQYLGPDQHDLGRRLGDDRVELFASGSAAQALQFELGRLAPDYIALHDVGSVASRRLLEGLAGAAGSGVQTLAVRRQGVGDVLAELRFVEIRSGGSALRVYSCDADVADAATRTPIAQVLLAHSRLGVLMVGELPAAALGAALRPIGEAIHIGPWHCRELLLLPLGSTTALAAQAAQLVGDTGVVARVTPLAARPRDAWAFISGTWNRTHGAGTVATEVAHAVAPPVPPRPLSPTQPMALAPAGDPLWGAYVQRCMAVKGVVAACVYEAASLRVLGAAGRIAPDDLAAQGAAMHEALARSARLLGLGGAAPEAAVTLGQQHLLLRPLPGSGGRVLHAVIEATPNNLTLARLQLERVAQPAD